MSVLAVIPARLGATRLQRKPLRLLGGAPLIVRVWERVCAHGVADEVVVATDSDEVVRAVTAAGGRTVVTSAAHPSGTDRVAEVARRPEFRSHDIVLNVQGDEPFVERDALHGALRMVRDERFPLGSAAAPASPETLSDPNVVKVVCADGGRALYFSRAAIPHLRDTGDASLLTGLVRQHLGIYAYTRDALDAWVTLPVHPLEQVERLEQLRPLAAGLAIGIATVARPAVGGIDTETDLARANARWDDLYAGRT